MTWKRAEQNVSKSRLERLDAAFPSVFRYWLVVLTIVVVIVKVA